jgi:uncharacterized phage protein (TIGR01671 family)
MNRELKFRVWDTKNNEFVKLVNFWVSPENLNKCFMEWRPELDGETVFETKNGAFVFQQFTGLRDREGKEIYEGDIIKMLDGTNYEVKFHIESNELNCSGYMFSSFGVKVIGNIFENPELLKK